MSSQILDALNALVTPALTSRASTALGESEIGVAKALGATFPALLSAVVDKSGDAGIARQLFALVTDPSNDGTVLRRSDEPPRRAPPGDREPRRHARVAAVRRAERRTSRRRSRAIAGLEERVGFVADPARRAAAARRARRQACGATGWARRVSSVSSPGQRDAIRSALPAELGAAIGGAGTIDRDRERPRGRGAAAGGRHELALARADRLRAALRLLVALRPPARGAAGRRYAPARRGRAAAGRRGAARRVVVRRTLPNGVELELPDNGLELRLAGFLDDAGRKPDENVWFDFDRIQFETGSAQLRPTSRAQLHDVAAILGAYPAVRVKIGGYTDDTGDPAANQQLSQARAESVRTQLVADGVAAERIEAEGYGRRIRSRRTTPRRAARRTAASRCA